MKIEIDGLSRPAVRSLLKEHLQHIRARAYQRLSLETGSMVAFLPARRLYASFGFVACPPFADYVEDANSIFMSASLLGPLPA
jgi:putative acetyltransferase